MAPMTRADLLATLRRLRACPDAQMWAAATPGDPSDLWSTCDRVDWLLWLAAESGIVLPVVLAACDCARTAIGFVPAGEDRPLRAIDVAERIGRGEITGGAAVDAAGAAVDAAGDAAVAAGDAAVAAAWAAAGDAAGAAARAENLRLVRARIPWSLVESALISAASEVTSSPE